MSPDEELEPRKLVKDDEERKPTRRERRRGFRLFNALLRRAAKTAIPLTDQVKKEQAKELRKVRNARSDKARHRRRDAAATRNRNRRKT